ncbi:MAG: hypothetical protein IJK93_03745 [Muribaculaceae bacterium]|nr:hypothetical protein [Muribaculaceae bacterium]
MKRRLILVLLAIVGIAIVSDACTSAIVSGKLTANGRPLLWKNRDTNDLNNRVERIKAHDGLYEFVALFDARDLRDTAAWMGFNEVGFAVMNTASYNLNGNDGVKNMDREGELMRYALERCKTVDDFEDLLKNLPKPLGVEANFGVIDAQGNGAYFETGNYKYVKYDLADAQDGILMRTNYSYSGVADKGYGYVREKNEKALLAPHIAAQDITPAVFTEELSRTFYNSLLGKDFTRSGDTWIVDQDFIPRRISTASVVIEGIIPGENPRLTTMWIALGYPPCAEVFPVWVGEDGVAPELTGTTKDNHSVQCDLVNKRKAEVFPVERGNGKQYLKLSKLYNNEGTGYCQVLTLKNRQTYKRGYEEIARRRSMYNKHKKH